MKHILKFMCLGMLVMFMTACSSNNPESVAVDFAKALYTGDTMKAKELCTHESSQYIDFMMSMVSASIDDMKETKPEVKVLSSDVDENANNAHVEIEVSNFYDVRDKVVSDESITEKIDLTKIDDEWKVVMRK